MPSSTTTKYIHYSCKEGQQFFVFEKVFILSLSKFACNTINILIKVEINEDEVKLETWNYRTLGDWT